VLAVGDSTDLALMFAATYPQRQRTRALQRPVPRVVAGSGIAFDDRGAAELKGVPGEWRLYAVASG
jgi:hypothetical protein